MKKWLAVVLTAVFMLSVLAGCNFNDKNPRTGSMTGTATETVAGTETKGIGNSQTDPNGSTSNPITPPKDGFATQATDTAATTVLP